MFQKNIELELQAVDILEKQLGKSLDIYHRSQLPLTAEEKEKMMEEERLLLETLEKTAKESNSKDEELKMDKHLQQILKETALFEEQKEELLSKTACVEPEDASEEPVASGGVKTRKDFMEPDVDLFGGVGAMSLSEEELVEEWVLNSLGDDAAEVATDDMYEYMPPIVKALVSI